MRIITPSDFTTTRWKNGGGITHEIARADCDGFLLWRLSLAEVSSDGPFSTFKGLARILTVVEGPGMNLHGPDAIRHARPDAPLAFSGGLPVHGELFDGPVKNLNLLYDPVRIKASVTCVTRPIKLAPKSDLTALYVTAGSVSFNETAVSKGHVALFHSDELDLPANCAALNCTLQDRG
ncbi:HutD family protein [Ruegeria sp. HKCCD8929]|uniref:HutD/Ves family protein n=1 Tax=Ruegeria sp. HKCCD8929 TaxID=2683006 RepID=UPI001487C5B4|nr:HutD family protein [Ruegeria sp. HKCCD8929]